MISLNGIVLPEDLIWTNRYSNNQVAQELIRAASGVLHIRENTLPERKMILDGGPSAVIQKTDLDTLYALEASANATYTLVHFGRSFTVAFDREDGKGIEADPEIDFNDPIATDWFTLKIKLIILAEIT